MQEPNPHTSRIAMAAGLALALGLAGLGYVAGRHTAPGPAFAPSPPPATPPPAPEPAAGPQILKRQEFLAVANHAADAFASGEAVPRQVEALSGRRFDLVLPFGCEGQGGPRDTRSRRWAYDPRGQILRITVEPDRWRAADWLEAGADGGARDLQGFWILRPWSSSEKCPVRRAASGADDAGAVSEAEETLALAGVMHDGRKSPRPFTIVKRLAPDAFDPARGFHLRLIGRIDPAPGTAPVVCRDRSGGKLRPRCLVAVTLAELRIENPLDGKVLGLWRLDGREWAAGQTGE